MTETAELPMEDLPPKEDAAPKTAKKRAPAKRRARTRPSVETQVTVILTVAGTGWAAADEVCGGRFLEQVPDLAKAINLWAQQDKRIYDWITSTTAASGPLSVAVAVMPVVQAVAIHHVLPVVARRRELAASETARSDEERLADIGEYVDEVVGL